MGQDPFEAPSAPPDDAEGEMDAESARRVLLPREGAVKMAVTPLGIMGGFGVVLGAFGLLRGASDRPILAGMVFGGAILLVLGKGARDFRPWARIPTLVVSALVSIGAVAAMLLRGRRPEPFWAAIFLFSSMPLFLLASRASAFLYSPDYAAIVRATPHMRYRPPRTVWIPIALLIAAVVAMVWWNVEVRGGRSV